MVVEDSGGDGGTSATAVEPGRAQGSDDHSGLADKARIAIPLGLALIAGAFVTLGIQGDLLPRLMRNSPALVILAFALGVFGVVVPLFGLLLEGWPRRACFGLGALLLLGGTVVAIWAAVSGTGIREQPTVTIVAKAETTPSSAPSPAGTAPTRAPAPTTSTTPSTTPEPVTTVQITATALSLASRDRMLLRVVAFSDATKLEDAQRSCSDTRTVDVAREVGGTVLFWGETGPTVTGSGTSSVVLSVSQDTYRYLCALAVLSAKSNDSKSEATRVITDLHSLAPLPTAS